jgi:hypothetical protein
MESNIKGEIKMILKLTKAEAIKYHKELWKWLEENPEKDKTDWPGWRKFDYIKHYCFFCEYSSQFPLNDQQTYCTHCPGDWLNLSSEMVSNLEFSPCNQPGSQYYQYMGVPQHFKITRAKLAHQIRMIPIRRTKQ